MSIETATIDPLDPMSDLPKLGDPGQPPEPEEPSQQTAPPEPAPQSYDEPWETVSALVQDPEDDDPAAGPPAEPHDAAPPPAEEPTTQPTGDVATLMARIEQLEAAATQPPVTRQVQELQAQNQKLADELASLRKETSTAADSAAIESSQQKIARLRAARAKGLEEDNHEVVAQMTDAIEDEHHKLSELKMQARTRQQPEPETPQPTQQDQNQSLQFAFEIFRQTLGVQDNEIDALFQEDTRLVSDPRYASWHPVARWRAGLTNIRQRARQTSSRPVPRTSMVEAGHSNAPTSTRARVTEAERMAADAMGISIAEYIKHRDAR